MRSIVTLISGILAVVSMILPWFILDYWYDEVKYTGWDVMRSSGEIESLIGTGGATLVLAGGAAMIVLAVSALILNLAGSESPGLFQFFRVVTRVAGVVVIIGAAWAIIDVQKAEEGSG